MKSINMNFRVTEIGIYAVFFQLMRWAGHVARIGAKRILVGKPEGIRPLGRPTHRWLDNIKMDHR
jgi:hypothetical protein